MQFAAEKSGDADGIARFFADVFVASEGAEEGRSIGDVVRNLLTTTPARDRHVFSCRDDGALAGCIVFSRLVYDRDPRTVFLLGPVAVETRRQGRGAGQALLRYGLEELGRSGADVAVTYGDPRY
ncbi:MAG: GNAT family N-acetyltransferase, partial [Roseovarius sp.]|nr:GNAT family N-acetyltransferase [Roseovarius sp.]